MKQFIRVMKAMSDPNRVRIIKLLQRKVLCVCELRELLGLAQSTVSKHLRLLDDAGLIESCRDGAWIIYSIKNEPESDYATVILENLDEWHEEDKVLLEMINRLPTIDQVRFMAA